MTVNMMKNSTYGHLDTQNECSRFVCVCSCTSGDGSHTKKFSRTWFSHRAGWVSLLTLHSTRCRMFSLCDSDSASQLFFFCCLPPPLPPSCVPLYHPIPALFHHLSFTLTGTMDGLNPGYLRRPDPSLIVLSHDTVFRLHDSADTLTQALLASYLSITLGEIHVMSE